MYRGDPEEKSRTNVLPGLAVLYCGAEMSLAGAKPAAVLAHGCEKRCRKAGDDRNVEDVEEKYHAPGIGEQVITTFI